MKYLYLGVRGFKFMFFVFLEVVYKYKSEVI
nr:MAG TPA: hypothetical protein [Caudoviricetes sp.]